MAFRGEHLLDILLLVTAALGTEGAEPECSAIISEINPGNPDVKGTSSEETGEFLELEKTCSGKKFTFADYSIVVWKAGKNGEAKAVLKLSLAAYNLSVNDQYLVLAGPQLASRLQGVTKAKVVSFSQQTIPGWDKKETDFMENGSKGVIAWVLYKMLNLAFLPDNTILSEKTANVDKIVDLVLYHRGGSISQPMVRTLMPGYALKKVDLDEAAVLKDLDKKGSADDKSLSNCCGQPLQAKWPLAFQHVQVTPGAENLCTGDDHANFLLNKLGAGKLEKKDRCNKDYVLKFDPPEVKQKKAKVDESIKEKTPGMVLKVASGLQEGVKSEVHHLVDTGKSAVEESIEQTTKQVTLLASIVGTIVIVLGLIILGGSYLYIRKRKLQPVQRTRARYNLGFGRRPLNVADSETEYESVLDREEILSRARVP
ncbi:hypothetical protein RvY_07710 [Ramazzottius varieornatus]|uniref:Uncharacterized protein n=1 Tax=Ramazzottius varieornatus TaxID=947166 RepID=A0A1D1V3A0_RAMVA|nr:hypothetical protein RvY_07710 [Ramazzottius varieornatus]